MNSFPHKSKFALIEANPREHLVDREISWLAFNERVLQLAEDSDVPLLERCRYLAIFSSNLDDFFMIRVATLKRKLESGISKRNSDRKSTRLNSSHVSESRMPSSA